MTPYYEDSAVKIFMGDCREILPQLEPDSIDTVISDPPYGLSFMGKDWDHGVPGTHFWQEIIRVAKPGAMLLSFGGTRTHHRLMTAIEDAGWGIRDCLMWLYGSGFPKSLDISKAIDKEHGEERKIVGRYQPPDMDKPWNLRNAKDKRIVTLSASTRNNLDITAPSSDSAKLWSGYGTALKPAWEPIILAMKPIDGTFAQNAEKWGVAGINVDGGRIGTEERIYKGSGSQPHKINAHSKGDTGIGYMDGSGKDLEFTVKGRFPANLILDEEAAKLLDEQSGECKTGGASINTDCGNSIFGKRTVIGIMNTDNGTGASRFFYIAKASSSDRGEGNIHPTVKPSKLMKYLCLLTKTPTGGIVLDPFMGSGSTLLAAKNVGRKAIGIELEEKYCEIAARRMILVDKENDPFSDD